MGSVDFSFDEVVFPKLERSERDWPEDFAKWYICRCIRCGLVFFGHKSRHYCKKCSEESKSE